MVVSRLKTILVSAMALVVAIGVAEKSVRSEPLGENSYFELSKGPCYGPCPVYNALIFPDGRIVLQGQFAVGVEETVTEMRSPEDFDKVTELLKRSDFWDMQDRYEPDWEEPYSAKEVERRMNLCGEYWTDHPTMELSYQGSLGNKRVFWNMGCTGFNGQERLETLIEEIRKLFKISN